MRIGVTGHRNLTASTIEAVRQALIDLLDAHEPTSLVGISCLAPGADSLFAAAVVARGGALQAIVPSLDYRDRMSEPDRPTYDRLLASASRVTRLPYPRSEAEAHMAASLVLVERSELLVAVWDGALPRALEGQRTSSRTPARKRCRWRWCGPEAPRGRTSQASRRSCSSSCLTAEVLSNRASS